MNKLNRVENKQTRTERSGHRNERGRKEMGLRSKQALAERAKK